MPASFLIGALLDGITGVVIAWITIYPILALYILRLGLKEVRLSAFDYIKNLYPVIGSTSIMGISLYLAKLQLGSFIGSWAMLLLLILLGALSYILSLNFLSPNFKYEIFEFFFSKKTTKLAQ